MARTVNFFKRAEKIKEQIDELVNELGSNKATVEPTKGKLKLSEIDFEGEEVMTLMQVQARLSRIILEKSK